MRFRNLEDLNDVRKVRAQEYAERYGSNCDPSALDDVVLGASASTRYLMVFKTAARLCFPGTLSLIGCLLILFLFAKLLFISSKQGEAAFFVFFSVIAIVLSLNIKKLATFYSAKFCDGFSVRFKNSEIVVCEGVFKPEKTTLDINGITKIAFEEGLDSRFSGISSLCLFNRMHGEDHPAIVLWGFREGDDNTRTVMEEIFKRTKR